MKKHGSSRRPWDAAWAAPRAPATRSAPAKRIDCPWRRSRQAVPVRRTPRARRHGYHSMRCRDRSASAPTSRTGTESGRAVPARPAGHRPGRRKLGQRAGASRRHLLRRHPAGDRPWNDALSSAPSPRPLRLRSSTAWRKHADAAGKTDHGHVARHGHAGAFARPRRIGVTSSKSGTTRS